LLLFLEIPVIKKFVPYPGVGWIWKDDTIEPVASARGGFSQVKNRPKKKYASGYRRGDDYVFLLFHFTSSK
jgi:hypothetical protein